MIHCQHMGIQCVTITPTKNNILSKKEEIPTAIFWCAVPRIIICYNVYHTTMVVHIRLAVRENYKHIPAPSDLWTTPNCNMNPSCSLTTYLIGPNVTTRFPL